MLNAPGSGPGAEIPRDAPPGRYAEMRTRFTMGVATRDASPEPVALAAGLHYASRADMVPCGACGLPIHRDRGRGPSGAVRAGVPVVNGQPVCKACGPLVLAGDGAAIAPMFRRRAATWAAVQALWAAREARES